MAMRMVERGASGPVEWLAPILFVLANVAIGALVVKTLGLLLRGALLPPQPRKTVRAAALRTMPDRW
jgi:tellurite resistance protein